MKRLHVCVLVIPIVSFKSSIFFWKDGLKLYVEIRFKDESTFPWYRLHGRRNSCTCHWDILCHLFWIQYSCTEIPTLSHTPCTCPLPPPHNHTPGWNLNKLIRYNNNNNNNKLFPGVHYLLWIYKSERKSDWSTRESTIRSTLSVSKRLYTK